MTNTKTLIEGIIVPLVTPFDAEDRIDGKAISRLVDFVISEGAEHLMPTALTGEGPLLTEDETLEVWDKTTEAANGRTPVIPAIVSTTTRQAVALAKAAKRLGAPAMMVAPIVPELYAGRSEDDVRGFLQDVAEAAPLPMILFNYPSLTGVDLTPSFVAKLVKMETVAYIKESTGDSKRVHAIHRLCGDRIEVITSLIHPKGMGFRADEECGCKKHTGDQDQFKSLGKGIAHHISFLIVKNITKY